MHVVRPCTVGDTAIHLCSFCLCRRLDSEKAHELVYRRKSISKISDEQSVKRIVARVHVSHILKGGGAQFIRVCEQLCRYFFLLAAHSFFFSCLCSIFVCLIYTSNIHIVLLRVKRASNIVYRLQVFSVARNF